MKISNLIMLWFLIISILMSFSTSSFFFLWMCMEINMMSFIPLLNFKNLMNTNSMMMYFIIQAFSSSMLIFSIIFLNMNMNEDKTNLISFLSLLMKMGASPFHMWFPLMVEGLNYFSFFLVSTFQKLIPLYMISFFFSWIIFLSIILSALIGSIGGFNQFSIRKLMAFSSISHIAWMLTLISINSNLWILYFLIYTMISGLIMFMFNKMNMHFFFQTNFFSKENLIFFIILLLSLGGIPPMIGFFMKWIVLKNLILFTKFLFIPLIFSSLLNLFFYMRLLYPFFLKNFSILKWKTYYNFYMIMFFSSQFFLTFCLISFL
uniref:NADH-ubiquinone oxidoreductase chain 2 n=1 Tax=Otobius megnini TaxID=34606 RepID=W0FGN9_OTOMG|nr:NADH dehydrogenase subunit 2 [Otobius megnini]AHF21626.1 NADH dehydrogenase subunit 2 [Otobius megnini]AIZ58588.1 NADH dehydrogenase subunit 2 [Otobius megnini]UYB78405.1 NADH dehydrogenase subunit 2 [Otobius megnini]